MPAEQIEEANHLLASPPDIDLSVSQRLGFHVVARLAARHGIKVALGVTPGSGTTALVTLPPSLFSPLHSSAAATVTTTATVATTGLVTAGVAAASASPPRAVADKRAATQAKAPVEHRPAPEAAPRAANPVDWSGWWDPAVASAMPAFNPAPANGASPAANAFGSATNGFGPATNGFGSATNGFDPTANGLGSTPNGFEPAANGLGRASHANGSSRSVGGLGAVADGREPGAESTGPARDAYGLVANGSGQATLGTGPNGPQAALVPPPPTPARRPTASARPRSAPA